MHPIDVLLYLLELESSRLGLTEEESVALGTAVGTFIHRAGRIPSYTHAVLASSGEWLVRGRFDGEETEVSVRRAK